MNRPMRVLQVSSHYPPRHTGGAERCCERLCAALTSLGHEVHVAAPVAASDNGDVRVRTLPGGSPRVAQKLLFDYASPRARAALLDMIDDIRPDVVHVHNVYGIGSRLIALASVRVPTVVTLHDYWPMDVVAPRYRDGDLRYPLRARAVAPWVRAHRHWHARQLRGAQLVSPSAFLAQRVGDVLGRSVEVIRNGLDLPCGETVRDRRILFAGRLVSEKGLEGVLPAMVAAAARHGWRIDVAGDGPLRAKLERSFPAVRFHGRVDPSQLFLAASILAVPSVWPENAPVVVLEGMAHGLAVIASASGGIPELVREGETGLLYPPGDVPGFERQLERLVNDEELRTAIGRRARAAAASFDWRSIAPRYVDAYERACAAWNVAGASVVRTAADPA